MNLKTKIYLSIIIFLALNIGLIFFLRLLFLEIKKVSAEISLKRADIISLEEKAKNSAEFENFFKKEEENFKKLDSFFIKSEMPVEFINFLEKEAKTLGLSLKISPLSLAESGQDPWSSIGFQLNSSGSFQKSFRFLEKLESSPYLIELQNLKISRIGESEIIEGKGFAAGDVRVNLSIKVYTK